MACNVYCVVLLDVCSCKRVSTRAKWRIGTLHEHFISLVSNFTILGKSTSHKPRVVAGHSSLHTKLRHTQVCGGPLELIHDKVQSGTCGKAGILVQGEDIDGSVGDDEST